MAFWFPAQCAAAGGELGGHRSQDHHHLHQERRAGQLYVSHRESGLQGIQIVVSVLGKPRNNIVTLSQHQASPENPEHTVAVKSAWVESNFYGLRSAIKSFGIERFKVNCVKATDGFNHVLERFQQQQNNLREMGHVKLAEFQLRKDNLKTQYNEKVELIREKSSAGWSQAKEAAKSAKEIAKESAKKKAEAAIKKAELAAVNVVHAETVED